MTYLASTLISKSWFLSGIVAREMESIPGEYEDEGLFLLNTLLDFKATDLRTIPYWTRFQMNLITGQEMYFIANLYAIETITFNLGVVRYPMAYSNRQKYFGSGRVDNIQSIPFQWHLERTMGGSNLYLYYLPQGNYQLNITGKFALTDVTLNQDMSLVYDNFYLEYLRYSLAEKMCEEWDISFPENKKNTLMTYEKKLIDVSPPDLTMYKIPVLQDKSSLNWAQINIGRGFSPS